MKTVFKTTFENGEIHFMVSKVNTVKTYISQMSGLAKVSVNKPHVHTGTTFGKNLLSMKYTIEIIASGTKEEMIEVRNKLVEETDNCINIRKATTNTTKRGKTQLVKVKKELAKVLKNSKGDVVYFINKTFGIKNGLMEMMNFSNIYPLNTNFCEIKTELNLI